MTFLMVLVGTVAFVLLFQKQIRRHPAVFYLLCLALDAALVLSALHGLPRAAALAMAVLMRKGGLGVAMFVVVMWIGVFPRGGRVSAMLRPIRAELSIMACLLIAGHMAAYLPVYLPVLSGGSFASGFVFAAFLVALALLALILPLGVTSLRAVKRRMSARNWKRLQAFAYLFYALALAHVLLMLGPSALSGGATLNVAVYLVVFGGYIVARIWRAVVDRREHVDLAETVKDQGFAE